LHPNIRLEVIGAGEAPDLQRMQPDGVQWIGYVPDPLPYLQGTSALLAPIPIAGGARQKIVEALATGCPIIATERAAEGLPRAADWLQLTPKGRAFGDAVLQHLADPEPGFKQALRAADWVRQNYSWNALAAQLDGFLQI
jgi:glycosyltransferase involved in cell wall biosynthesis